MQVYEVHELANVVAMANEQEQQSLMEDIRDNGQRLEAVLWEGKIVDGRCRQLACIASGVQLLVRTLDDSLTKQEVTVIVKSLNTRRNLTTTQKAMSALRQQINSKMTNSAAAKQWAITEKTFKNGKYVIKHMPEVLDRLFDGHTVRVLDKELGYEVITDKINTLARIVKKNIELGKVEEDMSEEIRYEFSANGVIKTELGKDWYYGTVKRLGVNDVAIQMLLVELANLKFKVQA